ncbi:TlpA disulfide reductase family protein [Winogradskyella sp. SYSU M77433]|uniref:TlpA family protein disulfide reductase n=1 Tax=Winogradskyella sp. SYSU M77433 TaxID=3042722 RepID=UPI00248165C2|nr:TlpA disulfide reductase family protein [Winogradskyella sp. SYSU M77433]MDH7912245.1 TlpA disulfide reductase family protein [Winogradskyella sp. SYSU M77433]
MKKFIFLIVVLPFVAFSQNIKGTFSPAEDYTYAFLYRATPDGANYIERGKMNDSGSFEITLDSTAKPGIYKIVYAIPPEENNFDFIYDGNETVDFSFSQDEGIEFKESLENKLWNSYLKSMDMVNQTISNYYTKQGTDKAAFKAIFKTLKETQSAYEESAVGKMVLNFIKANKPYIPSDYEDISTYSKNLKSHFFKNVDFSSELLQSSTFLTDRVSGYVFNMIENPSNEDYKSLVDDVAKAISDNDLEIKTSLLEMLWQNFLTLENNDMANYITDNYLLDLANKTNNKALAETITSFKNTSIGTKAPNFEISADGNNTSLHDLKGSDYYLLIFWSSGCGHCLNELPKVKAILANNAQIKVVAFGLEDSKGKWSSAIKDYPDFIHTIGLEKWDNPIVTTYGISATPTYFLLDTNKIIKAKPYDYEELEVVLKDL